jgi:peptidoglycan hydrolase CwlO-like protein
MKKKILISVLCLLLAGMLGAGGFFGYSYFAPSVCVDTEVKKAVEIERSKNAGVIAGHIATITQLQKQIAELSDNDLSALVSELQGQIVTLTQGNADYSATIISLNNSIKTLQGKIDAHDEIVKGLNLQVLELQSDINELTASGNMQADQIGMQASQIELLQNSVDGLNLSIAGHVATIAQLNDLIVYLQNSIPNIEARVDYVVTFYVNSAVWDMQITSGAVNIPTTPTGNWTFAGWSADGENIVTPSAVAGDVEYHAVINCAVTFIVDGETWATQVVKQNGFATLPTEPQGFAGWSLNGTDAVDVGAHKVVENTSFIKLDLSSISFFHDCWSMISMISRSGQAREFYNIGDTKDIVLSTSEVITVRILGFDHDNLSDGSGKAGITLGMTHVMADTYHILESPTSNSPSLGNWSNTLIHKHTLPNVIFPSLPIELRNAIKSINKNTLVKRPSTAVITTEERLFLFSERELSGVNIAPKNNDGEQYEYWATRNLQSWRVKRLRGGTAGEQWWLRSLLDDGDRPISLHFQRVSQSGGWVMLASDPAMRIAFGFAV